jgi:hypothetical protein
VVAMTGVVVHKKSPSGEGDFVCSENGQSFVIAGRDGWQRGGELLHRR